jgi:2-C-methyl-D-erythritol 2,4-cyclodiphosphate synthase
VESVASVGEAAPRVGLGFDVHPRSVDDRELWLGGVHFEGELGLGGHSDGDAVCHAIADAMLGAAALGDIGVHFPDSAPETEGIDGSAILTRTLDLVRTAGFALRSCDVTVIGERPAIAPRRDDVRGRLATLLGTPLDAVSVKATRPEGLGLTGDGIGCLAVVIVA